VTLILAGYLLATIHAAGVQGWIMGPAALVLVFSASSLGVALTNWLVTLLAHPRPLPRMDFLWKSRRKQARW